MCSLQKKKCAKDREDELSKEAIMLHDTDSVVLSENDHLYCQKRQTGAVL